MGFAFRSLVLCALVLVAGCGVYDNLKRRYGEFLTPEISLVSIHPLPAEGLEQRFELGLRIRNPNSLRIGVDGLSLRVELNEFPVLTE